MEKTALARIGAITFVAVATTMAALALSKDRRPAVADFSRSAPVRQTASDPLHRQLVRCQQLGEAATRNGACLKAWAESRRRFLAPLTSAGGTE